ncbi:MAG TPA: hypothetical protein VIF62_36615 [Labilithrix sp.]
MYKNVVVLLIPLAACSSYGTTAMSTDPAEPASSSGGTATPPVTSASAPPAAVDAGQDAGPITCPDGQGFGPTGKCVACTKPCGTGACVVGWEGGMHCKCGPGEYETLSGCAPSKGSPCDGIACSDHGTCFAGPPFDSPECHCEGDYVSWGAACARRGAIRCIDTDGTLKDKGTIRCDAANAHFEVCRDGDGDGTVEWVASGTPTCAKCTDCLGSKCDNGDGTGGQPCPTGTVCMGMVHDTAVYACQPSCDCSNCGTCDPSQFTGYQRACGGAADTFASPTKVCASPCPHAGDGCLPYGTFAFCFPNEGCASAAPP